jgi:hypothetical protein
MKLALLIASPEQQALDAKTQLTIQYSLDDLHEFSTGSLPVKEYVNHDGILPGLVYKD